MPEILNSLKDASAPLAGEGFNFMERSDRIQSYLEGNGLCLAADVDAVRRAPLTVGSKLLALARIVHDQGNPKGN